jgi:hypothetical protein
MCAMKNGYQQSEEGMDVKLNLKEVSKNLPFEVPEMYFKSNPDNILNLVHTIGSDEAMPEFSRSMPFELPQGYFDGLQGNIAARIVAESEIPEAVSMPHMEIPNGYFDELPGKILEKLKTSSSDRKKSVAMPIWLRSVSFKYAAAALVVLGIGFTVLQVSRSTSLTENSTELGNVSGSEISEFFQQNYPETATDIAINDPDLGFLKLDKNDIVQYLNENGWESENVE